MFKNIFKNDEWKRSEHMAVRECVGYYLFTHQLMEVTVKKHASFWIMFTLTISLHLQ